MVSMKDNGQLKSLVRELRNEFKKDLKTVVLFGSRARGEAVAQSDYDIFAVIENLPQEPIARLRRVRTTLLNCPVRVNVIAKTQEEMDKNLTPLLLEICVDGVCLAGDAFFESYRQKALAGLKEAGLRKKRTGKDWCWEFDSIPKREWELQWEGFRELA